MTGSSAPLRVAFATTARSEYFQMRPLLRHLHRDSRFEPLLLAGGSHLSVHHGYTIRDIEADALLVAARLETLLPGDDPATVAASAARSAAAFGDALARIRPDLLLVFGDRYEHLAVALVARCLGIAIAHVHGGEITAGAEDDRFRHALTKLSDLHFASTEVYAERIRQMGEAADRVFATGAPFVDLIAEEQPLDRDGLEAALGRPLTAPLALVAYHPATGGDEPAGQTMAAILAATTPCGSIVISSPNQDAGHLAVEATARSFAGGQPKALYAGHLGARLFHSLMRHADVMIGNSSAGLHEAAYYRLPVINVGLRQQGRLSPCHVIHSGTASADIAAAIAKALAPSFRSGLPPQPAPFGSSGSAERIAAILLEWQERRVAGQQKPFIDSQQVLAATNTWNQIHG